MKDRDTESLLNRFVIWRQQHISERQFVLVLSLVVGVLTAFAAIVLKSLIHEIHQFLTSSFDDTRQNYLFLLYPVIGIFLSGLFIRYVVRDDIGHGVTKILYALAKKNGLDPLSSHDVAENMQNNGWGKETFKMALENSLAPEIKNSSQKVLNPSDEKITKLIKGLKRLKKIARTITKLDSTYKNKPIKL